MAIQTSQISQMIELTPPNDWKDLQNKVAQILSESGLEAETEKIVETVRGTVEIDVFAINSKHEPTIIYLCECKHWKAQVSQTIVHAFRTVVQDFGAHFGLLISSSGYQQGAIKAASNSNIKLLTWLQFQETFLINWYDNYFAPLLYKECQPLVDYTEPFNSRVFRKADSLSTNAQLEFTALRRKYAQLAFLAMNISMPSPKEFQMGTKIQLPLKDHKKFPKINEEEIPPSDLLEAPDYRTLLDLFLKYIQMGLEEFDDVFGERA